MENSHEHKNRCDVTVGEPKRVLLLYSISFMHSDHLLYLPKTNNNLPEFIPIHVVYINNKSLSVENCKVINIVIIVVCEFI